MSVWVKGERLTEKAQLVMAVGGYGNEERKRWDEGIDYVASHAKSGGRILLRIVTQPKSESGIAGLYVVREMSETMKHDGVDKGVLISKSFTEAAMQEMRREGIEMISDRLPPRFDPQRLYLAMQGYVDGLCQIKCGYIPEKESDCRGKNAKDCHSCEIRVISDNASFHFERGWTKLVKDDFESLIELHNSVRSS